MPLSHRPLDGLTEADLQGLITGAVPEGRRIEYKRDLPGNSDGDRKEFLADVSSFANAAGGDLIYGIEEANGLPSQIAGVSLPDPDAETLRLESIIRNGVAPRIPGFHVRAVPLASGTHAVVIRVPQSWLLPHMVTLGNSSRFFSRASAGKYPLDVTELRTLFARSGDTAERIRRFRDERLARIIAGEGAFPLTGSALVVMHILPFRMFDPGSRFDLGPVSTHPTGLTPLRGFGFASRYNLDGFATYSANAGGSTYAYTQLFRSGAVEAVNASMLEPDAHGKVIPSSSLGFEVVERLPGHLNAQRAIGVDPPLVILLALLGVKGYQLATRRVFPDERAIVDRDLVQAPEVIVDDWGADISALLRPAFDTIWNAAGLPRCTLYREDGTWSPD